MNDCERCSNFCEERDDPEDDMEIEEDEEDRLERENEKYADCDCGAFIRDRHGIFHQVADCCCGKS